MPTDSALAVLNLNPAIEQATKMGKEGVEVLERLHAIAQTERAAASRAAWVRAMSELRKEMPHILKTQEGARQATYKGGRKKGLYAPLDTITSVLDPLAAKHGLSYRFDREVKDGRDFVVCIVGHVDGHEESSRFPAPSDEGAGRNAIQSIASGDSYAKRYSLISAFGITTADPDDDGEAASRPPVTQAAPPPADEHAVANLVALLDEAPNPAAEKRRLLEWVSKGAKRTIASIGQMTPPMLKAATKVVEEQRAAGWPS